MTKLLTPVLAGILLLLAILGCRSTKPQAPSWTKAKVLSADEDHPSKIVTDGSVVCFVTGGTVASMNEGTNNIKCISLSDGAVTILVKGGQQIPEAMLALDERYLYWSDGGNILRVPKAGGTSEKIIPNVAQPDEIVMDGENFYWLNWAGEGSPPQPIMFAPKKGGEAKQLTPPQPPTTGLCLEGGFVYFMTGDGIKKIPKGGGEITDVYHNPSKQPSLGLRQDADNFYYTQMNAKGHSELMKLNKKSGELVQLTPSISHTQEFVLDEANIYFFDYVPGTGSFGPDGLYRISKTGGDRVMLDQGDTGWLKYLAVDGKQIYFTDISKVYALAK
jgi:hypothetical protein